MWPYQFPTYKTVNWLIICITTGPKAKLFNAELLFPQIILIYIWSKCRTESPLWYCIKSALFPCIIVFLTLIKTAGLIFLWIKCSLHWAITLTFEKWRYNNIYIYNWCQSMLLVKIFTINPSPFYFCVLISECKFQNSMRNNFKWI